MDNNKTVRRAAWIALCALAACATVWLWQQGIFKKLSSLEELHAMISAAGPWAGAVYFLLQMLTVIFAPVPSNVTMLAGALILGFLKAFLLGISAVIAGSLLIFLLARRLGQRTVQRFLDRSVMDKYLPLIREKQEAFLFLTMLFPFFPDDVLCILAGLTDIPLSRFAIIMVLTRPWGLAFAALLGSGAVRLPVWGWIIMVLVLSGAFCLALRHSAAIENHLLGRINHMIQSKKENS